MRRVPPRAPRRMSLPGGAMCRLRLSLAGAASRWACWRQRRPSPFGAGGANPLSRCRVRAPGRPDADPSKLQAEAVDSPDAMMYTAGTKAFVVGISLQIEE